jgi:Lon protease-like protein
MTRGPFDPTPEDLPEIIPIFPLPGVLLLPGGGLPLNIFEPRYLAMTLDALAEPCRLIGMIQPSRDGARAQPAHAASEVYQTGCAGRIVGFREIDDGRILITLRGVSRFDVLEEIDAGEGGYRQVRVDWSPYFEDLDEREDCGAIARNEVIETAQGYFEVQGLEADWQEFEELSDEKLVTALSMYCPFEPREKQALLEANSLADRAETLTAVMKMALSGAGPEGLKH